MTRCSWMVVPATKGPHFLPAHSPFCHGLCPGCFPSLPPAPLLFTAHISQQSKFPSVRSFHPFPSPSAISASSFNLREEEEEEEEHEEHKAGSQGRAGATAHPAVSAGCSPLLGLGLFQVLCVPNTWIWRVGAAGSEPGQFGISASQGPCLSDTEPAAISCGGALEINALLGQKLLFWEGCPAALQCLNLARGL